MQQEEAIAIRRRSVAPIQFRDPCGGCAEQLVVAGRILGGGVRPIGKQREAKIAVAIGQMMNLQPFDLLRDCGA